MPYDGRAQVLKAIRQFLTAYDMTPCDVPRIIEQGEDNLNIDVSIVGGRIVVRRYELTRPSDIAFELDVLEHLTSRAFPVPRLYRARDGERMRDLMGRPAAVFGFVDGSSPSISDPDVWRQVGRWLSNYHEAVADFVPANKKPYGELSELDRMARAAPRMRELGLDDFVGDVADFASRHKATLRKALQTLPSGVIHADFRPDNLLCRNGELVAVLDFDTSYIGSFVRDLAEAIVIWSMPVGSFLPNRAVVDAIIAGYCEVRRLSEAERDLLPVSILLTCLSDAIRFIDDHTQGDQPLERADECSMYKRYLALRDGGLNI